MQRCFRLLFASVALVGMAAWTLGQTPYPPPELAWDQNKAERSDPRPLEIGGLSGQPVVDGVIGTSEWAGATQFVVREGSNPGGAILGTLYFGVWDGKLYTANDWTVNNNPDPNFGAGNAWRIGTSNAPGPGHIDSFFDVYVDVRVPPTPEVWFRQAPSEDLLQFGAYVPAPGGITANAQWNVQSLNWQYELGLAGLPDLPVCWYWEWRQIDPRPDDGVWVPVYNGSIHHTPEPALIQLPALMLLGGLGMLRYRRRAKK